MLVYILYCFANNLYYIRIVLKGVDYKLNAKLAILKN